MQDDSPGIGSDERTGPEGYQDESEGNRAPPHGQPCEPYGDRIAKHKTDQRDDGRYAKRYDKGLPVNIGREQPGIVFIPCALGRKTAHQRLHNRAKIDEQQYDESGSTEKIG